jgi:transposase InsO family protein
MSQRQDFIELYLQRRRPVSELCLAFGVSEKTGYKWIARYQAEGPRGLADQSRAPANSPQRVEPELIERIVALRRRHPTYGARKLRWMLDRADATTAWPAPSTIGELLKRRGLVRRRRRRRDTGTPWDAAAHGLTVPGAANEVWTADFKGQFRLGNAAYCYPLTLSDLYSRYLLTCVGLPSIAQVTARVVFMRAFREFGLPWVIRTDNGVPFAQPQALGRLSPLSVWWIRLGIRPERIEPSTPQQNGAHERMHKTLKADTARPPAADFPQQQRRFDRFRHDYNVLRPHESLEMTPPANRYTASARPLPRRLPPLDYPGHREVRLVCENGTVRWRGDTIHLTRTLAREYVSFEETDDASWTIAFGPLMLGGYDERRHSFNPEVCWQSQSPSPRRP